MRILVISDLPHFVTGGAEVQAARLIEAWLDAGHEVVCLGRRMETGDVQLGRHSIRVHRIRTVRGAGRLMRAATYFLSLARLLIAHRSWADVVYTRFLGEAAASAALLKSIGLLGQPLIPTPAGAGIGGDAEFIARLPIAKPLSRLLGRRCDAINLIAPQLEGDLLRMGFDGAKFTRIPNGIDVSNSAREPGAGRLRAVSVGRLTHQKGLDELIRAFASVPGLGSRLMVDIIGAGPDRSTLERLVRDHHLVDSISFVGELAPAQARQHLLRADLFVLPSRYEGMSNAVLEAMEARLPVLVTRCGGIDTFVEPSMGWVVPVEDTQSLARALSEASWRSREELELMGAKCRALVEQRFDIRVTARQYVTLFERLIAQGHRNESHRRHT